MLSQLRKAARLPCLQKLLQVLGILLQHMSGHSKQRLIAEGRYLPRLPHADFTQLSVFLVVSVPRRH